MIAGNRNTGGLKGKTLILTKAFHKKHFINLMQQLYFCGWKYHLKDLSNSNGRN
jgi:hypothetical protein